MAIENEVKEALLARADEVFNDLVISGLDTDDIIANLALLKGRELLGADAADKLPASAIDRDLVTDGALAVSAGSGLLTLGRYNPVTGAVGAQNLPIPAATPSAAGLLSAADKTLLIEVESRVDSIEQLGHYLGYVQTVADLPATQTALQALWGKVATINDFANVQADEDHDGESSRYLITDIDPDGALTWAFELQLSYPERDFNTDPIQLDEIDPAAREELDVGAAFPVGTLLTIDPVFAGLDDTSTAAFEKMDGHKILRADCPVLAEAFPTLRFFSDTPLPESQSVSIAGLTGGPLLQQTIGGDRLIATAQGFLYAPAVLAPTTAFQYPLFYSPDFGVTWERFVAGIPDSTLPEQGVLTCEGAHYLGGERAIFVLCNPTKKTVILVAVEGAVVKSVKLIKSNIGSYAFFVIPTVNIFTEGFAAGGVFILAATGTTNSFYVWYWQTGYNGVDVVGPISAASVGGSSGSTLYYSPVAEVSGTTARISVSNVGNSASSAGAYLQASVGSATVGAGVASTTHTGIIRGYSVGHTTAVTSSGFYVSRVTESENVFLFMSKPIRTAESGTEQTVYEHTTGVATNTRYSLGGLRGVAGFITTANDAYQRNSYTNAAVEAGRLPLTGYTAHTASSVPGRINQDEYSLDTFLVTLGTSPGVATLADALGHGYTGSTLQEVPGRFKFLSSVVTDALGFSLARGELIAPRISQTLTEVEFRRHPYEADSDTHVQMLYRNNTWVKLK